MISNRSETAIDEIVARCNGDVHGALKALLLVNEQLEAELQQLYAKIVAVQAEATCGLRLASRQRSSITRAFSASIESKRGSRFLI